MFNKHAPDGLFVDDDRPSIALNTYHKSLHSLLDERNVRRLRVGMPVKILSQHNQTPVDAGVVREIIPAQMFAGDTGRMHDAVIAVKLASGSVTHFAPHRVVPDAEIIEAMEEMTVRLQVQSLKGCGERQCDVASDDLTYQAD
jgi:predicted N-formylglutamate amidohydrolase